MKKRVLSILLIMSIITSIFTVSAATADAAVKPATPSVTIVNGGSANGLYVKWNSVGNKASYQVAYRPAGSYGCGQGYSYKTTSNTNITLTGLKSGVSYQVQVRAYANGVYTLFKVALEDELGEETPYELIEEMLLDHPDIDDIELAEGCYILNVVEDKAVKDNRTLKALTTDEVEVMCSRHQDALNNGDSYRADFSNCLIVGFQFINYDISEMNFNGAVLMFCDIWDMGFNKVDFSNSILVQCTMANNEMSECKFRKTSFRDTQLVLSHCSDCDFAGSEFRYSDVSDSEFHHTNLTGTKDICSNMDEADTSTSFFSDVAWRAHCWMVD